MNNLFAIIFRNISQIYSTSPIYKQYNLVPIGYDILQDCNLCKVTRSRKVHSNLMNIINHTPTAK